MDPENELASLSDFKYITTRVTTWLRETASVLEETYLLLVNTLPRREKAGFRSHSFAAMTYIHKEVIIPKLRVRR